MLATTGLCRFRVGQVVMPQYLCQFLNGIGDQLRAVASEAVQPFLNMKTIGAVAIPIPPLAEQRRIVAKVDQLIALVDELETQLADSRATARSVRARRPLQQISELWRSAEALLETALSRRVRVRHLRFRLAGLARRPRQMELFAEPSPDGSLTIALDRIRARFGETALLHGLQVPPG